MAYALTDQDFAALARNLWTDGGFDRVATVVKAIRAERGDRVLLLDGGDTWTNSWTSLQTKAADVVEAMNLLKPDAMTGHWEFTLGADRVKEIVDSLPFPFLAQNMRDTEFEDPVFEPMKMFEKGGVKVAVIGQAYPYTAIANPRWMFPKWQFGLREEDLQKQVEEARAQGAGLVVLLSHNGFDIDRKMAGRVKGIDIILTAHTHDALPEPVKVGRTLLIASGCCGKFLSRIDIDVAGGEMKGVRHRLIPIFSDAIAADAEMAALVKKHRAPFEADLARVLGRLRARSTGAAISRARWTTSSATPCCRSATPRSRCRPRPLGHEPAARPGHHLRGCHQRLGHDLSELLPHEHERGAPQGGAGGRGRQHLQPDPYLQGGGDMVRVGGLGFAIDVSKPMGSRISELRTLRDGKPLEAARDYVVAGWASINEGTQGPPIWEVVSQHLAARKVVDPRPLDAVKVTGA